MFYIELLNPALARALLKLVERRIPFRQSHGILDIGQDGQQLAKPPHATLIQCIERGAALLPKVLKSNWIGLLAAALLPRRIDRFQQFAALGAAKVRGGGSFNGPASHAAQLRDILFSSHRKQFSVPGSQFSVASHRVSGTTRHSLELASKQALYQGTIRFAGCRLGL